MKCNICSPGRLWPGLFIIGLLLSLTQPVAATKSHTDSVGVFLKLLDDYDPSWPTVGAEAASPDELWHTLVASDQRLSRLNKEIRQNKRDALHAVRRHSMLPRLAHEALVSQRSEYAPMLDSLARMMGFDTAVCTMTVFEYDLPLTMTVLTDRGFAILLSSGLLQRGGCCDVAAECDLWPVVGICARQYVHGILMHPLQQFYEWEHRVSRHRLWALLASVVAPTAALTYADYDGYYAELRERQVLYGDDSRMQWLHFLAEPMTYYLPLGDEKHVEADIVAFRMMQRLGHGEAFERSLDLYLEMTSPGLYSLPAFTGDELQLRRALIRYAAENPDLKKARKAHNRHLRTTDPLYND